MTGTCMCGCGPCSVVPAQVQLPGQKKGDLLDLLDLPGLLDLLDLIQTAGT